MKGSPLSFELIYNGSPYGGSGTSTPWSWTNVALYLYSPTIVQGIVTAGYVARDTSGTAVTEPVTDTNGNGYFNAIPAGHYTVLCNLDDGVGWQVLGRYRSVWHGIPETVRIRLTGDGAAETFGLSLPGGDGIHTSIRPWQGDIEAWYMGYALLDPTTDYTLALATAWPWDNSDADHTNALTVLRLPKRGGGSVMTSDEYIDLVIRYLPGGQE